MKKLALIVALLLLITPSYQSEKYERRIPSKEDVMGFLNAIENRSNDFFDGRGNILRDLTLFSPSPDNWLENALMQFYEMLGIEANESEVEKFIEEIGMPDEVQQSVALLLYAYMNVSENRNKVEASIIMLYVIRETYFYLTHYSQNKTVYGPYGKIVVGGEENNVYNDTFFVMDFGGNDVYHSIPFVFDRMGEDSYQNMTALNITYVTIDAEGDDEYNEVYSSNASYFLFDINGNDCYRRRICSSYRDGFFFLLDYSGDDSYKGENETQCFSYDSISFMVDLKGNDEYIARDYSQASSRGGISLLVDFFGDDRFIASNRCQAYAVEGSMGTKSVAVLINFGGIDTYIAKNFSQGYSNNMGFAILFDFLGDDSYSAKLFSQASSNAMGISAFIDTDGKNKFRHGLFCQGYMLGSMSLFMNNFEMSGSEKILERIERLNYGISDFLR